MLAELWAWLTTPCPPAARRLGYLRETIAIGARRRRCRDAWQTHLDNSRAVLLAAAQDCPKQRTALILGSGHLLDVPLAELAARFERVLLVDVLHPPRARRLARRFGNVRLLEHDLTECNDALLALPADAGSAALAALGRRQPQRFLDEPDIDLVASVNLWSQLPLVPAHWLARRYPQHSDALEALAVAWLQNHLAYLRRFPARVCLITDAEQTSRDRAGTVLAHTDLTPLLPAIPPFAQWEWPIAPDGETAAGVTVCHRVVAVSWAPAPSDLPE